MKIRSRNYSGESDKKAMANVVRASQADNLHVVDLPYRLSSWAFDTPENIRLWHDKNGALLAWAVMQTPFWTIDYAYSPKIDGNIHQHILTWADHRAKEIVKTPSKHPTWYVNVFPQQLDRIKDLENIGFASQAHVEKNPYSEILLQHVARSLINEPILPKGYSIRPLASHGEVGAYVELHRLAFGSKTMTASWKTKQLNCPEYDPDIDLVIVAPNGRFVAFCVCWLYTDTEGHVSGQIEPLGVHPDFRQLGLAKAVLVEGLRRMYAKGAKQITVITESYRQPALALYESVGFHVKQKVLMYRKDYA